MSNMFFIVMGMAIAGIIASVCRLFTWTENEPYEDWMDYDKYVQK